MVLLPKLAVDTSNPPEKRKELAEALAASTVEHSATYAVAVTGIETAITVIEAEAAAARAALAAVRELDPSNEDALYRLRPHFDRCYVAAADAGHRLSDAIQCVRSFSYDAAYTEKYLQYLTEAEAGSSAEGA